jgi:hypothetical protein
MAEFFGSQALETIPVITHKIGERVSILVNGAYRESPRLVIRDISTGYYFNKQTKKFEDFSSISKNGNQYDFIFIKLYDTGLYSLNINTLPNERQDLLFVYTSTAFEDDGGVASTDAVNEGTAEVVSGPFEILNPGNYEIEFSLSSGFLDTSFAEITVNGVDVPNTLVSVQPQGSAQSFKFFLENLILGDEVEIKAWALPFAIPGTFSQNPPIVSDVIVSRISYEKRIFGGSVLSSQPQVCTIYGRLLDVSGKPMVGQKIEVYLNRAGYFTHKAGLVGYAATALSDETGYWEIPIIVGLDVTINVPIIGFSQSGFVPPASSVELTPETLLKYRPN